MLWRRIVETGREVWHSADGQFAVYAYDSGSVNAGQFGVALIVSADEHLTVAEAMRRCSQAKEKKDAVASQ